MGVPVLILSELNSNEKYKIRAKRFSNKYATTIPQHAVYHVVRLITNMLIQHKIKSVKAMTLMCVGDENEF